MKPPPPGLRRYPRPPAAGGAPQRPSWRRLGGEFAVGLTAARLAASVPRLELSGRVEAPRTILIPGWQASELSMAPLRRFLSRRGVDAQHWGFGKNRGNPEADARRMLERLGSEWRAHRAPVALVGWSLGGVIAREVARERPDLVSQVITYGTPIVGGPRYTITAGSYPAEEIERIDQLVQSRDAELPIQVPLTVIFSKRDGIVDWRACIDRVSPDVEHFEARSAHLGMGIDPDVWRLVLARLARSSVRAQT